MINEYVNPINIMLAVVIAFAIYFSFRSNNRYLKFFEESDNYKAKSNVIIFWNHILLTISSYLYYSFQLFD